MNSLSFREDGDCFQRKCQRPPRFTTPDSNCTPKFRTFCRTLVWYSEPAGQDFGLKVVLPAGQDFGRKANHPGSPLRSTPPRLRFRRRTRGCVFLSIIFLSDALLRQTHENRSNAFAGSSSPRKSSSISAELRSGSLLSDSGMGPKPCRLSGSSSLAIKLLRRLTGCCTIA